MRETSHSAMNEKAKTVCNRLNVAYGTPTWSGCTDPVDELIGTMLSAGDKIAKVGNHLVTAPFDGVLRGLVHDGLSVQAGCKIADLDPRGNPAYCYTISDKALAVGGGVVEALFSSQAIRDRL